MDKGTLIIYVFLSAWVGFAAVGIKKKWSIVASVGGGFIFSAVTAGIVVPVPMMAVSMYNDRQHVTEYIKQFKSVFASEEANRDLWLKIIKFYQKENAVAERDVPLMNHICAF